MLNFNGVQVSMAQMQRKGLHVCPILLRPGSIIDPGNWGRIIRLHGHRHDLFEREETMERIRAAEFPNMPSRHASTFYCPDVNSADWFRRKHACNNIVYSVVPLDADAPVHVSYMNCLPPLPDQAAEETARRYWRADLEVKGPDGFAPREVLTTAPLLVLQNLGILE